MQLASCGSSNCFQVCRGNQKITRGRWCGIVAAQTVLWAMGHDKPSGTAPALPLLRSGRRVVVGGLLKRNGRRFRHRRLWQWTLHACAICAPGRGARLMARSCSGPMLCHCPCNRVCLKMFGGGGRQSINGLFFVEMQASFCSTRIIKKPIMD